MDGAVVLLQHVFGDELRQDLVPEAVQGRRENRLDRREKSLGGQAEARVRSGKSGF